MIEAGMDWDIKDRIKRISFNKTSSMIGVKSGACVLIGMLLERKGIYILRHGFSFMRFFCRESIQHHDGTIEWIRNPAVQTVPNILT